MTCRLAGDQLEITNSHAFMSFGTFKITDDAEPQFRVRNHQMEHTFEAVALGERINERHCSVYQQQCGHTLSSSSIVLFSLIWNTLFACSQAVASLISGSLALMGDSSTMFIDSVTYVFNYWLEREKAKPKKRPNLQWIEIIVSSASIFVLVAVSIVFFALSISRLLTLKDSPEDVEAPVIFGFATVNLMFDILSTILFVLNRRKVDQDVAVNINLCSAFLHILADLMRTISELVAALLVMILHTNSEATDAYCAIVVEVFVLAPAAFMMVEIHGQIESVRQKTDLDAEVEVKINQNLGMRVSKELVDRLDEQPLAPTGCELVGN